MSASASPFLLEAQAATAIEGVATSAAASVLDAGVLGALVIIFLVLLVTIYLRLNQAQAQRVQDQKDMAKELNQLTREMIQETAQNTAALREFVATMRQSQDVIADLRRSVENVVAEAVRGRHAPPTPIEIEVPRRRHSRPELHLDPDPEPELAAETAYSYPNKRR